MSVSFECIIKKFKTQGEKTGWTYIEIPAAVAAKLKPATKTSFRVKGKIDHHKIEKASLLPMGGGNFILPLNKTIRTSIKKQVGAKVTVNFAEDKREFKLDDELMACLNDEPAAYTAFTKLPPSHQRYYSKWITDAKTQETKTKRIARTITGMLENRSFGETLKWRDD